MVEAEAAALAAAVDMVDDEQAELAHASAQVSADKVDSLAEAAVVGAVEVEVGKQVLGEVAVSVVLEVVVVVGLVDLLVRRPIPVQKCRQGS